jgi:DNA-binding NarL/FixJ family response regulator
LKDKNMAIKIVIVDDNSFLIKAIAEKLSFFEDISVKFTALNGKDLLMKLESNTLVDLILMDIEMPEMNGIEATFQVKQKYPQIKIIMLTVFDNDENIFNAIKAGADGYLLKEVNPDELHQGIIETLNGGAAMNPSIALKTLKLLRNPINFETTEQEDIKLTSREIEVLEQLSKGLNYNQIADNLILSPSTVRKHIENIYTKLQVHNKLEAIEKARNNNLI